MNDFNDVDARLNSYMQRRQHPDYQNECGLLVNDKARLLTELEQLRMRNQLLERELKELLESYDDMQKEQEQQQLQDEKTLLMEQEIEQLKQQNEKQKQDYQLQIDWLKRELDITTQEKQCLQESNLMLKNNIQNNELYQQIFQKQEDTTKSTIKCKTDNPNKKFVHQIDHFKNEVSKLRSIVQDKIVKKKQSRKTIK